MKGFMLSLLVLCAVLATAYSLKCYLCVGNEEDCKKDKLEADKDKYGITCPDGATKCIRGWGKKDDKTIIAEGCATESECEKDKKACDEIKDGECAVACCDKDYCNAGSPVSFSMFLMTVCSTLGLALLK